MASVFLSYAREDAAKAKALATCLERAGQSVWWDRHIHGGSEFAGEIEQALRSADVVIVLWSEASMRSAWVRDEAAEGRDSGRLVPLLLDGSAPPLGFRQLQSISIAGWSGRGNPPAWAEIRAAIGARTAGASSAAPAASTAPRSQPSRRLAIAAVAFVGALLVAVGGWWLVTGPKSDAANPPVLAVLPFADLSPEGDKAYLAEGVAEAILTTLAKEPGIKVIGRNSAKQLHDAGSAAPEMRRALGVTHVLEGSARSIGDQLRMSVRLVDADDGQQIWAEEYARRLDNIFAVQDEIGRAVAEKLRGSFGGAAAAATPITKADIYALYLAARSKMRDRRQSSLNDALGLAKRVIAADSDYAPGHALYAELIWHLSTQNYGTIPEDRARAVAERHARKAITLAPQSADGYAALGMVLQAAASLEPLQTAIRLDPARAEVRQWLGQSLVDLGRQTEALAHFRAAVEMDPLRNPGAMMLAYVLAASERYDEAEESVARFEQRGGSPSVAAKIRGDIANYRGDYSEAVRLTELALAKDRETPQADLSAGWYFYALGLHDRAVAATGRLPRYTRMLLGGQREQLAHEVRAAGGQVWQRPDASVAIEALAYKRDWHSIAALHDAKRGIVDEVCNDSEAQQLAINLAAALRGTGRGAESERLLRCVRAILERQGRGTIRSPYLPAGGLDLFWAQLHALRGEDGPAFERLSRSIDRGIRTPHAYGLSDVPAFDAFRADPRYTRNDTRLKQLIARERAEYLATARRAA